MNLTTVNSNSQKPFFSQFKAVDWLCFTAGIGSLFYYLCTVPLLVLIAGCVFGSLYPFLGIPFVESTQGTTVRSVKLKLGNFRLTIKLWHLLALAGAIVMVLMATPSHAFFLTTAQNKIEATICAATSTTTTTPGTGAGTTCSAADLVTVIFDVVRIVVVFAVIGGVVAIVVQGQQQQDVRPAVMFVGVVFGTVLTVESLSRWLLG